MSRGAPRGTDGDQRQVIAFPNCADLILKDLLIAGRGYKPRPAKAQFWAVTCSFTRRCSTSFSRLVLSHKEYRQAFVGA